MVPDSLLHSDADELLHKAATELRQHLETGEDCHAETVLSAFPSLASDPHRALELIVLEFQLRRQLGQNPQPSEWYKRFPHWRESLQARLEGTPPEVVADSKQETVAVQTAPYCDAQQKTAVEVEADVPVLGRHEILEEIDRGGMGVIYRARDRVLDRIVALKVIRSGSFASDEEVRRFYREARAAAQLRHPNIVPIYGMGLYEQQHCFTMPLFARGSLIQHLADYRQDVRGAVALLVKVARAVQTAHEQGIVHRDLKPANILLDERGEPVVSDFGLAKRIDVSATLTQAAHAVGTPAYMAPEQVRCEAATTASDIWSLGVILYELLTGCRPFPGNGAEAVKQNILSADVVSPRRLRRDLPRDLATIVLTCLEKEPKRRYPSAAALADDLERWQRGEAIRARPESRWHRLRRQFRRRVGRRGVLLLLIGLMLLGGGAAGVWTLFYLAPAAREQRRQEQVLASLQRELAEGRSVTLVEELGPPKWYRWRTDKGRPPLQELRKWPLQLEAVRRCSLLELLPDPQRISYRFAAEVRAGMKLAKDNQIEFGLYFACEKLETPEGTEQCFGLFRLVDHGNQMTKAELRLIGYFEQDVNDAKKWNELRPTFFKPQPPLSSEVPPSFTANPSVEIWHRIEVHVTPAKVQTFCDGCPMGAYDVANKQGRIAQMWRATHPASYPQPTFLPRGGLGLYASVGAADFRNVVVEPLPQP